MLQGIPDWSGSIFSNFRTSLEVGVMQAAKPTDPVRIAALLVGNAVISFESISNRANVILGPIWNWRISLTKYLQDPDMMIWFRQRRL